MPRRPKLKRYPLAPLPAGLPNRHALLVPAMTHAFEMLRVSAALRDAVQWHAIHSPPQPLKALELEHGKEHERQAYNDHACRRVRRERKTLLGKHGGFADFFVPILTEQKSGTRAIEREKRDDPVLLITGPFSTARPTSAELLERWSWLTGRPGHASDPEFVSYVAFTLDTLLLEGEQLARYQRMLECLVELLGGRGNAHALGAEASALRTQLEVSRFVDHAWEAAHSMVDVRSERTWLSPHKLNELWDVGLRQLPEHVLVALWTRSESNDRVEDLLAHDAFQRACVALARESGNALAGRMGEQGVMFLVGADKSARRSRDRLLALGEQARALGRRKFALKLHLGLSASTTASLASARYEEALGAAESALSRGVPVVTATPGQRASLSSLRELRDGLGDVTTERPAALAAKFDRYLEAVYTQCGYRIEAVRAHLDAGFERAVQGLRRVGVLGERNLVETYEALDSAAQHAASLNDLGAAYRKAVSAVIASAEDPVSATQDRNLRRSLEFIQRHFNEPISLNQIARVAGIAPRHFTRLFKEQESTTFERYLQKLRIERSQQLLLGTDLSVERIAQLSGFGFRPHFHRVFRKFTGKTPAGFRSHARRQGMYR